VSFYLLPSFSFETSVERLVLVCAGRLADALRIRINRASDISVLLLYLVIFCAVSSHFLDNVSPCHALAKNQTNFKLTLLHSRHDKSVNLLLHHVILPSLTKSSC
jgi:hypothetical protein